MTKNTKISKTSAASAKSTRVAKNAPTSSVDGVFFLKLVLYAIVGSMWIKITHGNTLQIPLPFGLLVGLIFATHEHFQIDRKIEFAVLVVAMLVGYLAPYGLYINF